MISSDSGRSERLLEAEKQLKGLLEPLPLPVRGSALEWAGADLVVRVGSGDQERTLVCEFNSNGQPRFIRSAALQARELARHREANGPTYPVVMAPFISPESGAICRELGVGYADLAGNCLLSFGTVYIEKSVAKNPFSEKREQRSLFAPKSARLLRIMLGNPDRDWRVAELAGLAGVSYGQVSKVRQHLLDREWASAQWGGLRISRPQALLEAWGKAYTPLQTSRNSYYTLLHGEELNAAIREFFLHAEADSTAILSSFSAARWQAPYARLAGEYFYADKEGENRLKNLLKLESAAKGENVTIDLASDEGVFQDGMDAGSGLRCTSPIQTWLDLSAAGERGQEAARHLLDQYIAPKWKTAA